MILQAKKNHFTTADTAVKTMSLIFKAKKRNDLEGKKNDLEGKNKRGKMILTAKKNTRKTVDSSGRETLKANT